IWKSMSVRKPGSTCKMTSPPRPPSPPSGPPMGTYFSRRKLTTPLPPSPPFAKMRAASRNNASTRPLKTEGDSRPREPPPKFLHRSPARRECALGGDGHGVHADPLAPLAHGLELDVAVHQRVQRVVLAHADVLARVHLGAPLAHDDVARRHQLAAVALYAQPLALAVTAVLGAAAALLGGEQLQIKPEGHRSRLLSPAHPTSAHLPDRLAAQPDVLGILLFHFPHAQHHRLKQRLHRRVFGRLLRGAAAAREPALQKPRLLLHVHRHVQVPHQAQHGGLGDGGHRGAHDVFAVLAEVRVARVAEAPHAAPGVTVHLDRDHAREKPAQPSIFSTTSRVNAWRWPLRRR